MRKMNHFNWAKIGTLFLLGMIVFQSCKDEQSPGYEYMPNMYRSPSVETYSETDLTPNGLSALQPAEGSIPQGFMPYPYPNTAEGYAAAGENLKNPIPFSEDVLAEGKAVFTKMCIQCHGKAGKGDGTVASNPRWPGPPPAYDSPALKDLPEGKIFHSIHWGKGLMGAHNSLITQEDRWKLVHYVQYLQDEDRKMATLNGDTPEEAPASEETEAAPAEGEIAVNE